MGIICAKIQDENWNWFYCETVKDFQLGWDLVLGVNDRVEKKPQKPQLKDNQTWLHCRLLWYVGSDPPCLFSSSKRSLFGCVCPWHTHKHTHTRHLWQMASVYSGWCHAHTVGKSMRPKKKTKQPNKPSLSPSTLSHFVLLLIQT